MGLHCSLDGSFESGVRFLLYLTGIVEPFDKCLFLGFKLFKFRIFQIQLRLHAVNSIEVFILALNN